VALFDPVADGDGIGPAPQFAQAFGLALRSA
jgi:hypothetical protein